MKPNIIHNQKHDVPPRLKPQEPMVLDGSQELKILDEQWFEQALVLWMQRNPCDFSEQGIALSNSLVPRKPKVFGHRENQGFFCAQGTTTS